MPHYTFTTDKLTEIYDILITKSWSVPDAFDAYQDAWEVISRVLGISDPHDGRERVSMHLIDPAKACTACYGSDFRCPLCKGKGWYYDSNCG